MDTVHSGDGDICFESRDIIGGVRGLSKQLDLTNCPGKLVCGKERLGKGFGGFGPLETCPGGAIGSDILGHELVTVADGPWSGCASFTEREEVDDFDMLLGEGVGFDFELPLTVVNNFCDSSQFHQEKMKFLYST